MKPILIAALLAALVAGFVGAATVLVLSSREQAAAVATEHARATEHAAAAAIETSARVTDVSNDELRDQITVLAHEIDELRDQLDGLRSGMARQETPSAVEHKPINAEQLASVQRDAVVQIMQEERDKEAAKREEERKQREQQAIADRSARIAKELGLGAADERKLTEFLTVASAKRDEMFRGVRDGNFDRDAMRKNFDDMRTWAETELNNTFGANLGGQIMQANRDWRGDFGGGWSGGGGAPWPNQGQTATGGSSRRGQ
jgi:hypothetical protein